ncbi:NAD kinase [Propionicicella superfundia]|uniref:NAD kinase n=1 Tax=Propionicicella superfundia TaxID=348582 RepID=UPI00040360D0|nr:NAD kinase [Propionicicella superfundia]
MADTRVIALALHPARQQAFDSAVEFISGLRGTGILCLVQPDRLDEFRALLPDAHLGPHTGLDPAELSVAFGGDGTILRAAEWAVPRGIPILGVNLGHVGFLAELEASQIPSLIDCVVNKTYRVERRLTVDVTVRDAPGGEQIWSSFAINEVSLEKQARERMIDVLVEVDGRPLSRWWADGLLVSTPSGSTAYAFSASGPVVWPDVFALLLVPLSAHALFARPMVLSPLSTVRIRMLSGHDSHGVVWCDGRRTFDIAAGMEIEATQGAHPLLLARTSEQPFTTRLVRKFGLPVDGWRNAGGPRVD